MNFCSSSVERTPLITLEISTMIIVYASLTEAGETVIPPAARSPLSGISIVK